MTSRLDRLFILLESGSSIVTRRAAAKQIGEVQRLHPHELHNLLNRLIIFLQHANWDTRIAAAQAVEAILTNVPKWNPIPNIKNEENLIKLEDGDNSNSTTSENSNRLCFSNFDLKKILEQGARLMGSEGTEFDFQEDKDENSSDRLQKQRQLLGEKIGFNTSNNLGITIDDIVTLDDMKNTSLEIKTENVSLCSIQDMLNINNKKSASNSSLSCREKNRAKRKARQSNPNNSSSGSLSRNNSSPDVIEPENKKNKIEINAPETNTFICNDPVPDATGSWGDATEWPFTNFCSKLYTDLLSPRWETRHGTATALRELIKLHTDSAGKDIFMSKVEMETNHQLWMEDAALRLLCVIALDRFGDFVSDQVVAPVRETCAQVLGTILKQMSQEKVEQCIEILLMLTKQKEWEVRHGGLLGLKYLLVVREDLLPQFLPSIVQYILSGLFDSVDDIGAVAASTLIPIVSWLPKLLSPSEVSDIVKMLWDLLLDQDELTSACNSFMGLLSSILSLPNAALTIEMEPMSKLIPRLWPFLCHSSSSVRRSTLQTLYTLTLPTIGGTDVTNICPQNPTNNTVPMKLNFGVKDWPTLLLQESLRHVYQRVLIEHCEDIQDIAVKVWINLVSYGQISTLLHAACPYISSWLCLAMQPARLAFDPYNLVFPSLNLNKDTKSNSEIRPLQKMYLGGTETIPLDIRENNVTKARCKASLMLGLLSKYIVLPDPGIKYTPEVESPIERYSTLLIGYLNSRSALQRLISSHVIANWALCDHFIHPGPANLQEKLNCCLNEYIYYDEVALLFTRLLQESRDFIATLKQNKIPVTEFDNCKVLTLDEIQLLCTTMTENLKLKYSLKPKLSDLLEDRRKSLHNSFTTTSYEQNNLNISVQAALAGAAVTLQCLPEKLNPVIKPLMESIKREENEMLQQLSAKFLVLLLDQISTRNPCPNNKIITNICRLLKSDVDFTPKIIVPDKPLKLYDSKTTISTNPFHGILTLSNRQNVLDVQNVPTVRGPGRPPALELTLEEINEVEDPCRKQNRIQRIGSTFVINAICSHFNKNLKIKMPVIWELMLDYILKNINEGKVIQLQYEIISQEETNDLVTALQLIEVASINIHPSLHDDLFIILPKLGILLSHPLKAIRHLTSRCLAVFATMNTSRVMDMVIDKILPFLSSIENLLCRQGAAEAISLIINKLQFNIVPYVVLMVVPLLGRMSDPDISVRLMSTQCFATLIQLMPLDGNTPELSQLSDKLKVQKEIDRKFLDYLFTPKTIPDYKIPVPINAELRSYQQAGINWLWFLNKYKLHGILCDDMGLGKTLQTICILAGDHYQRNVEKCSQLPSLVICPPTLTGHWVYEVNKFLSNKFLKPLHYIGLPADREKLRHKLNRFNLVVASYDIVRKDIDFFASIHWNYCVLDEGHIIKNGKTKCSKAIKNLVANHRLILSGTPIQNNVLELWSLFDFLMPGFLGTEKQFMTKFSRPILASRDAKSSPKEQEAGALAMEGLHRQVLPFLLRRVKEDVLTDLPPKITQDLLCDLSTLQEKLYEDLSKTQLNDDIRNCLENIEQQKINKTHVFQALRYLQNVCNHPKLVLKPHHPEYQKVQADLQNINSSLDDINHSGKLPALKQLLLDCGIGNDDISVNQHRALIFCQLKAMLDIIENDLLKKHLPAVSYLRIDGSVPASSRHMYVTKFNQDPSIDVLLLTTQVGGLGLNLTGADTVIFVEHDWNPMKDLQAMDRAHRIGQKKVVNVYRLITRKSLEEKIMGLQKFKLMTANTIVSNENASMDTMGTDQLLDLFNLNDNNDSNTRSTNTDGSKTSMKNVLESLPELWDDRQYEEEYDLSQFLEKLK